MKKKYKYGIILPLKESYLQKSSGAVSIFVNEYLKNSKLSDDTIIFTNKLKGKYLTNNVCEIEGNDTFFSNLNYIKKICKTNFFTNLEHIEIHNRPLYAEYIKKNFPNVKISLFLHNTFFEKNSIRNKNRKNFLLNNCDSVIFVSNFLKKQFFNNLNFNDRNNAHIIYNSVSKAKTFNFNKEKIIVFAGKLNKSKGFNIFIKVITKILDKFPNWKGYIIGNEKREKYKYNHKNLFVRNWISNKELLNIYNKSSISVVNPRWDEPFGRTALESSSRGCAVVTSKVGGLPETFKNNLVLKKNNENELFKILSHLITKPKYLLKIQKENFKNQVIDSQIEAQKIDYLKKEKIKNIKNLNGQLKIIHIGVFGEKQNYRTYNLSLANKISNGFIKNNHHVINIDYRSRFEKTKFAFNNFFINTDLDDDIYKIVENYKPDMVLLGHNNILNRDTVFKIKKKFNTKIVLWYEDHVTKNDPNAKKNLELIEKNHDLIDQYFITTHKKYIKSKINKSKINFLPMPVDESVEKFSFFKEKNKSKDLFFGISHGVNRGILKKGHYDNRIKFINNLIKNNTNLKFNFLGFNNHQPKWNEDLFEEMKVSNFALNLSRGGPYKYTSSNRIATYIGNGMPTFVDKKLKFSDFFNKNELLFYKDEKDIIKQISNLLKNPEKIYKIGKNGKKKYFRLFNNIIVSDYIISKTFKIKGKFSYIWEKK